MANTKEIKNRISSVNDTKKITNAMYLIASTKLRKAKKDLQETLPYFEALREEIKRIFRTVKDLESPYFYPNDISKFESGTYGILVITSDKGLAGSYNMNVIKETMRIIENTKRDCKLFVIGEFGRQYFSRHKIKIEDFYFSPESPSLDQARRIADILIERYLSGELRKIFLIYSDNKSAMETVTKSTRLLPFHRNYFTEEKRKIEKPVEREFEFVPSVEEVLDSVIDSYISGYIYSALIDSYSSEQQSRMNAMSTANQNAENLVNKLNLQYNKVRQAAITQEITEVSAGAKAQMNNRKKISDNYE